MLLEMNNKIENIKLLKIEKSYINKKTRYVYSIKFSNIEEDLILESDNKLDNIVGLEFKYKLDDMTNEVIDFKFE